MLKIQVVVLSAWLSVREGIQTRFDEIDSDQGEVTSTTIMIGVLALAAVAAGVVITGKIQTHTGKIP
jgi:hypothetical protein